MSVKKNELTPISAELTPISAASTALGRRPIDGDSIVDRDVSEEK
jgi:hypothetical protein